MTSDQILKTLRAQPFRPFVMKTTCSREYRIDHPELAIVSPSGRTMSVADSEDTFAIIDVLMVESINTLRNGRSRRWRKRN